MRFESDLDQAARDKVRTGLRAYNDSKSPVLRGFRERGAHSKSFPTRYYSADVHKAALVLPEFMREALGE